MFNFINFVTMKKIVLNRQMELTPAQAYQVEELFEMFLNFVEGEGVTKKDTCKLQVNREVKMKLFKYLSPVAPPLREKVVSLNESTQDESDTFVSPFEIMNLLRVHR